MHYNRLACINVFIGFFFSLTCTGTHQEIALVSHFVSTRVCVCVLLLQVGWRARILKRLISSIKSAQARELAQALGRNNNKAVIAERVYSIMCFADRALSPPALRPLNSFYFPWELANLSLPFSARCVSVLFLEAASLYLSLSMFAQKVLNYLRCFFCGSKNGRNAECKCIGFLFFSAFECLMAVVRDGYRERERERPLIGI